MLPTATARYTATGAETANELGPVAAVAAVAAIFHLDLRRRQSHGGLQKVRNWVLQFNAEGPDGLVIGKVPGNHLRQ